MSKSKPEVFVYSTLTSDVEYVVYREGGNDVPTPLRSVLIQGKVGIADRRLFTPLGMCTRITDEQYQLIKDMDLFKLHVANGFIKVDYKEMAPEKASSDMNRDDPSAPMTPASMSDIDVKVHSVGNVDGEGNSASDNDSDSDGGKRKRKGG